MTLVLVRSGVIHLAETKCVWRIWRSRYPEENIAWLRLYSGNATLWLRRYLYLD